MLLNKYRDVRKSLAGEYYCDCIATILSAIRKYENVRYLKINARIESYTSVSYSWS